jgi:glucose/arabinose dehydrogenase
MYPAAPRVPSLRAVCCLAAASAAWLPAQSMIDPSLGVATVVSGLSQPIAMAFLGPNDLLVTEKASGQVKRVTNGAVAGVVLDLPVNSASERGLLGIAKHPHFHVDPSVYLFWTESLTGADSTQVSQVPLLGHRVDRFTWNGSTLTYAQTLLRIRTFQEDLNQVTDPQNPFNNPAPLQRGNHNGGVLRFGHDNKLYIVVGDVGRRGWLQNNFGGPVPDDQFGGPIPDQAHTSGVIFRLHPDGSTPTDNPLWVIGDIVGAVLGGPFGADVGDSIKKLYAIGIRNCFGMTFDLHGNSLWTTENGGRAFDEINRVTPGFNGGWIQVMGPLGRVNDYKSIEVAAGIGAQGPNGLQQLRWPASNIANSPAEAAGQMVPLAESRYTDPEFSWKHVVPPAGLGFVDGDALGHQYCGDLIVGSAVFRPTATPPSVLANPGHLYRFRLDQSRTALVFNDPALQDKVADNLGRDDWQTEGAEILWGTDFGIVTDIQTGPDGNLWLVGTSSGTIRKIHKL